MDDSGQDNRFAPPGTVVADVAPVDGLQLATRWNRFAGAFIDGMFGFALSLAVMLPMYGTGYFKMMAASKLSVLTGLAIYLGVWYAVQGWFLYQRNQSLGKMAMGTRIVRADGSPASFGRAFGLRLALFGAFGWIPSVGPFVGIVDALFIFGKSRRCLHDLVADTVVVTAVSAPLPDRSSARAAAA